MKDHPVCLSAEGPLSIEMEKVLSKQPGSEDVKSDKVLELNVNHPVFAVLKAAQEAGDADKVSKYSACSTHRHSSLRACPWMTPPLTRRPSAA